MCPGLEYLRELHPAVLDIQPHLTRSHATVGPEADTVCDVRALSRKALLRVLEKFPEEEEQLVGSGHVILERSESQPIRSDDSVFQLILASLSRAWVCWLPYFTIIPPKRNRFALMLDAKDSIYKSPKTQQIAEIDETYIYLYAYN